jgi:uncharacterized protein (DUF2225 family)
LEKQLSEKSAALGKESFDYAILFLTNAIENAIADAKDKTVQVNALKQQNQKLTQLVDIYEIDSKKNKQSLDASSSYEFSNCSFALFEFNP